MNVFIYVVIVMFLIDVIGKIIMIEQKDFIRNPRHMIFDAVLLIFLIMWGVWLVSTNAAH